jgi:hypothetical protein
MAFTDKSIFWTRGGFPLMFDTTSMS